MGRDDETATVMPAKTAAKQGTTVSESALRVRECKVQVFRALQRRQRGAWKEYWTAFQKYLKAQMALEQFHATAERLLGQEHVRLHNAFVVTLLQDYSGEACVDPFNAGSTKPEESRYTSDVKLEPGQPVSEREIMPDTESAELLMGLGKVVTH